MNCQNFLYGFGLLAGAKLLDYMSSQVVLQNQIFKTGKGFFRRQRLMDNINTIFIFGDHLLETADLALNYF